MRENITFHFFTSFDQQIGNGGRMGPKDRFRGSFIQSSVFGPRSFSLASADVNSRGDV